MSNISNGMVVVKVYHIQPEEVEALFVHRLHVGVMIRAPELLFTAYRVDWLQLCILVWIVKLLAVFSNVVLEMEKIHSMFPRVEELSQLIPTLLDNVSAIWSQVAHVIVQKILNLVSISLI